MCYIPFLSLPCQPVQSRFSPACWYSESIHDSLLSIKLASMFFAGLILFSLMLFTLSVFKYRFFSDRLSRSKYLILPIESARVVEDFYKLRLIFKIARLYWACRFLWGIYKVFNSFTSLLFESCVIFLPVSQRKFTGKHLRDVIAKSILHSGHYELNHINVTLTNFSSSKAICIYSFIFASQLLIWNLF